MATPLPTTPGLPTPNTRDSSTTWQRPSIRIRRLSSSRVVPRARAATVGTGGRSRRGGHRDNGDIGQSGATPRLEAGSSTRPASGYFSDQVHLNPANRSRSGNAFGSTPGSLDGTGSPTPDEGRRRSSSDPTRTYGESHHGIQMGGLRGAQSRLHMPPLQEGLSSTDIALEDPQIGLAVTTDGQQTQPAQGKRGIGRRLSNVWQTSSRFIPTPTAMSHEQNDDDDDDDQYETDLVNVLDAIDPEISTLNTLTNVQNSLFVPDLGRYLNRRPTYTLTRHGTQGSLAGLARETTRLEETGDRLPSDVETLARRQTTNSLTSTMDEDHFAVLPHGERLEGWSAADRAELNDHVRHLLHSRREGIKRGLKGFKQYVKKPLGFFVTVYATLITLFGTAWVLFLIGWINLGGRRAYIINVVDNVLVALFAIMGDGLAPFRAVDTYHMCFIAHYHHLTWRLRKEKSLPKLQNHNDLPGLEPSADPESDVDTKVGDGQHTEVSVLNPSQQKRLEHHQKKFARSHTFYKPHETTTHFAFPLRMLVAVVVLLDCHSLLQISLGACTWGIDYRTRPFALTTVILCCSLTCNITAGVLISIGDRRTRKKDVLERMFRQELTAQAIEKLQKRHEKENERNEILEIPGADVSTPGEQRQEKKDGKT